MYRPLVVVVTLGAALAIPGTALAGAPGTPPNIHACNGIVVAGGDHPAAAPAFFAQELGLPVDQAIALSRQYFDCQHP